MDELKNLLHELRCDIAVIQKTEDNKLELNGANETLKKAWKELSRLYGVSNHAICDDWIHKERVMQNDDNYCPICGKQLQSK